MKKIVLICSSLLLLILVLMYTYGNKSIYADNASGTGTKEQAESTEPTTEESTVIQPVNAESTAVQPDTQIKEADRFALPVNFVSQFPELPTGCEITALATVLNYLGYPIDKTTLSDVYLPKGEIGSTDFNVAFVGNPRDASSYGCYAGAIMTAARYYLQAAGGTYHVYNISGSSIEQLYNEVSLGNPVLVWGTVNNSEPKKTAAWVVNGEKLEWISDHCYVLIGFDKTKNTVIVSDPMVGITEYDESLFFTRYVQLNSQAIVIK